MSTMDGIPDLEQLERKVLELNSKSEVLVNQVLFYYVQGIEALFPEMHCSIMKVKNGRLYGWVAPSLPKDFQEQIEGIKIDDNMGSCGTAAFLKETVIVADIAHDIKWEGYQEIALAHHLLACWSRPIVNSSGQVMATFAMYYGKVKVPNAEELKIIERASSLLQVILESRQYAEALKSSNELYDYVNRATNDAIYDWDIVDNNLEWGGGFFRVFGYQPDGERFPIQRWVEMIHQEDLDPVTKNLREALRDAAKTNWTAQYRLKRADESYAFIEESGYIVRNDEGEAIRMVGTIRDITERINYIHTIEQQNHRLKDIAWAQTHLVRAPLARIMGLVQLLREPESENVDEQQVIAYLHDSAKELDGVIRGIIEKSLS
ncbi:PAS domain-containing protein [Pedobacter africanus]|uniref:histidine kinase n=1 Tax=Pedobacter africanus TaxID=151894 RepID=A0A1W2AWW5_9SPHI|nr:PAS domain-containing protein [Pedobacter africanus]SMC65183.1 PAS domain S-box-containing protein [Pedobacter africanus]